MRTRYAEELEHTATAVVARLRHAFRSDRTRALYWRKTQLRRLLDLIRENEKSLLDALARDLGRPRFEAWLTEINYLIREIDRTLSALDGWARPRAASVPLGLQPGKAYVQPEPLGVVLIISPWNYPIQLCLSPLVAALAAGNCAVLKPSEISQASSQVLAELVPRYLDGEGVAVVEGGVAETTALLRERWDHILFTGSERVGKIVMAAAAQMLTPVTLELGGKSPVIVDHTANLQVAAKRILWSKSLNAGQSCIAADYVLVEAEAKEGLVGALVDAVKSFFGENPQSSPDYGRIVSQQHFDRLSALMQSGRIIHGGRTDRDDRFMEVTLLDQVPRRARIMEEEIFGPLLPIITVKDVGEAIEFVNEKPKPLAVYLFSSDQRVVEAVVQGTSSGAVLVNDCVVHFGIHGLPFGGVGESGMGAYHGQYGFNTFSHLKGVLRRRTWIDPRMRYPPYTKSARTWINWLL